MKNITLIVLSALLLWNCSPKEAITEKWMPEILNPDSEVFLPDFSYAGYHWGEKAIPQLPTTMKATDFGVIADDGKDDTEALKKAFAAAHAQEGPVVLELPAGKLIVSDILYIERSNFVLRGAGSDNQGTVLYFPIPLNDLPLPEGMEELQEYLVLNNKIQNIKDMKVKVPYSLYAWTGGFVWDACKRQTH